MLKYQEIIEEILKRGFTIGGWRYDLKNEALSKDGSIKMICSLKDAARYFTTKFENKKIYEILVIDEYVDYYEYEIANSIEEIKDLPKYEDKEIHITRLQKCFGVFENDGAGEVYIKIILADDPMQEGYFSCDRLFDKREEAEQYIEEEIKKSTVYAVFFDNVSDEWFISEEHCYSGNWRGSKYPHYTLIKECKTKEEAEEVSLGFMQDTTHYFDM